MLLTFYISKIQLKIILLSVKLRTRIYYGRLQRMHTIKMSNHLIDMPDAIYLKFIDNGSFADVIFGYEKTFISHLPSLNSNRKCSLYWH